MLVLTRKKGEGITISDNVNLVILGVHGNQVRLGIDAPHHISVHRNEVYAQIQTEKRIEQGSSRS